MIPVGEYPELTAAAIEQLRAVLYGAMNTVNLSGES